MNIQETRNKRGEIEFRRKLYQQQVAGEAHFDNEYDADGIEAVLLQRMADTRTAVRALMDAGVQVSPYLEVGAERGQRSLVMENDLGAEGAALDLSLDLLRSCEHYANRFDRPKLPLRICGDAYRLPFRTGSLPFVFCYQTLHHFPSPDPVVAEIHRVLAPGGHFFFAEEPYRRLLHLNLVRTRGGVHSAPRGRFRKLLRNLFVEETFNEEDFGVIEKHDTSLPEWDRAMSVFESGSATLELDRFRVDADARWSPLHLMLKLLGGRIGGLYRKAGEPGSGARTIREALAAPARDGVHKAALLRETPDAYVTDDGRSFPVVRGVALLMDPAARAELYPELDPAGRDR